MTPDDAATDSTETAPSLKRLVVINQVAGPLMVELLSDLRDAGIACRVLTGQIEAEEGQLAGVEILRGRRLIKKSATGRIWAWGLFTLQAIAQIVRFRREPILVVTNPPLVMLAMPLLRKLFGVRYAVLVYDIYPDVMERMGAVRAGGLVSRLWRRLSRNAMLRSDTVVTLGTAMARTLGGHLMPGDCCDIHVVPTWVDTRTIRPIDRADNLFAKQNALADKFVVMYSGSFGATHDIESIIEASERLSDAPDVQFVLIGGGTRWAELTRMVEQRRCGNVRLLPFQRRETLPYSLAAADCQIVALDEAYAGISVPSKTYYALAAGCALLAIGPAESELAELVKKHGCGLHIPPRRPDLLEAAIRRMRDEPALLAEMRGRARQAAEECYARARVVGDFATVLADGFGLPRRQSYR